MLYSGRVVFGEREAVVLIAEQAMDTPWVPGNPWPIPGRPKFTRSSNWLRKPHALWGTEVMDQTIDRPPLGGEAFRGEKLAAVPS